MKIEICPTCGEKAIRRVVGTVVLGDRQYLMVPHQKCSACGERLFGYESNLVIAAQRAQRQNREANVSRARKRTSKPVDKFLRGSWTVPEWVKRMTDDNARGDVEHAIAHRGIALGHGAKRTAEGRELLRQGDALLARVEARPTAKNAADLASRAEDFFRKAGRLESDRKHAAAVSEEARAIGNLRRLYQQMIEGVVRDTGSAARGLLGPAIEVLESAHARRNPKPGPGRRS